MNIKDLKSKLNIRSIKASRKRRLIVIIVIIAAAVAVMLIIHKRKQAAADMSDMGSVNTGIVMRGDISNELTSSGTLSPKNTYTITSLVTGEILSADFKEGDQVEEGQILYVIDDSDITKDVDSASRSLDTAKTDYEQAVKDYNKAISELGGGTVKSAQSGYVKNISIKAGDTVGGSDAAVAELYNDNAMTLRLAFLTTDADSLSVGQDIVVELSDTGETIPGRIEEKSDLTESINSGTMVKYVSILVSNPGGLSISDRAIAYAGDIRSISDGTFEPYLNGQLKVELPSDVKVSKVLISEGQYVSNGTALFSITADSLSDAKTAAKKQLDQAENSLTDAENNVSSMNDTVDKYTITAPISGQVITKKMKAGDKISNNSNSTNELALIYDLSELTFQMSIDELDISKVKVGQTVKVTADAFSDKSFTGHVTNVGLNGTASNGVTTYPVVVTLDETDGLLPGMNVDGVIILEQAKDTLYIPANALQRGNIVYVKNDSLGADTSETEETEAAGDNVGAGSEQSESAGSNADGSSKHGAEDTPAGDDGVHGKKAAGGQGDEAAYPDNNMTDGSEGSDGSDMYLGDAPEGFTAVKVETGIISNDYVEILSGLTEGQEVYVKDSSSDYGFYGYGMDMGYGGGPDGGGPHGDGGPQG